MSRSRFGFLPDAMLPAWFVTDSRLLIRNANEFARQLLGAVSSDALKRLELGELTIESTERVKHLRVSLWECLLDPRELERVEAGLEVLRRHREILLRYRTPFRVFDLPALLSELRSVEGKAGIRPYVFNVDPGDSLMRIGLRFAPPEGLKLLRAVPTGDPASGIEDAAVTQPMDHIDVVLAYQVRLRRAGPDRSVTGITFLGTQPAIHDANQRHRLVRKWKELDELKVTQHLSHALKTPLANAMSLTARLQKPELSPPSVRELAAELQSQIDDIAQLSDLLLFINTNERVEAVARTLEPGEPSPWLALARSD